jgi:hypothetical protein
MASDGMIYLASFLKFGSEIQINIKVETSTVWEVPVLVILTGSI